ncbi:MAG: LytTR family DNA-binding domain-containing protein [Bacteroidales bacterium]
MKTVIVDDESDAIYTLELIIQSYLPELNIVGKYTDPEKAIIEIPILKPELIFLDINMPVMNGFELLEKINNPDFNVIFTTAYDEFALKAFKYNALDYLLKPIDISELAASIYRIKSRNKNHKQNGFDFRNIINEMKLPKEEKITISTNDGIYFVNPSEIVYLMASGSYTKIIRKDGDIIMVSKLIKDIETLVGPNFYRVHRSYIINLKHVKMMLRTETWELIMENGDKIPIARGKKQEVANVISAALGNGPVL